MKASLLYCFPFLRGHIRGWCVVHFSLQMHNLAGSFLGCGAWCVDGVKQFRIPEENRNVFTVESALCELQEFIFSG